MKECCRTCEDHIPRKGDVFYEECCVMCSVEHNYNPNSKCDNYYEVEDKIDDKNCRLCWYYNPVSTGALDEYGWDIIHSCKKLNSDFFMGTCPEFKLWDGVHEED